MAVFKLDPSQRGLRKTLREYEEIALRYVWSMGEEGVGSSEVWKITDRQLGSGKTISRSSVIVFLNRMVEQGVLAYRTRMGLDGHRRIYYPKMTEYEYKKHILRASVESLLRDFPEETKEALEELEF